MDIARRELGDVTHVEATAVAVVVLKMLPCVVLFVVLPGLISELRLLACV